MPIFGQPLVKVALRTRRSIPSFLESAFLCVLNHSEVEGLFRIAGSNEEVARMEVFINATDRFPIDKCGIHTVCNLITRFIRQIPGHLLVDTNASEWKQKDMTVPDIQKLIAKLPLLNIAILSRVCAFFRCISLKCDKNKMTPKNLAIILSPNIIFDKNDPSWLLPIEIAMKLIDDYYDIFSKFLALDENGAFVPYDEYSAYFKEYLDTLFVQSQPIFYQFGRHDNMEARYRFIHVPPVDTIENFIDIMLKHDNSDDEFEKLCHESVNDVDMEVEMEPNYEIQIM